MPLYAVYILLICVTGLTVIISIYVKETKKIKLFYLHCSCETLLSNKLGECKNDQKYFAR